MVESEDEEGEATMTLPAKVGLLPLTERGWSGEMGELSSLHAIYPTLSTGCNSTTFTRQQLWHHCPKKEHQWNVD